MRRKQNFVSKPIFMLILIIIAALFLLQYLTISNQMANIEQLVSHSVALEKKISNLEEASMSNSSILMQHEKRLNAYDIHTEASVEQQPAVKKSEDLADEKQQDKLSNNEGVFWGTAIILTAGQVLKGIVKPLAILR